MMQQRHTHFKVKGINTPILLSDLAMYSHYYKENRFFSAIKKAIGKIGKKACEKFLQIYYLFQSDHVPTQKKILLVAAMGYFISPIDLIPDFIVPFVGFTDDLAVAEIILLTFKSSLTEEIKQLAHKRTLEIFRG